MGADPVADLAELWRWFADTHCAGYSPLYERLCREVAGDDELLSLVREAPPASHLPPLLLAAVHDLVLDGRAPELADVYAGESDADPVPLVRRVCRENRTDVAALLATRRLQTNEVGRCAAVGPALTWVARELGSPLALVDVGSSAGLNLLCDRFRLDYGALGATGPVDSSVVVRCEVAGGRPPLGHRLPALAARVGIEHAPLDLQDPDDARWLLACVWPDTDRLDRTRAAIALGAADPPPVVAGDALTELPGVLATLPPHAVPVVVTTWAFGYLHPDERVRFSDLLNAASTTGPLAWVCADDATVIDSIPGISGGAEPGAEPAAVPGTEPAGDPPAGRVPGAMVAVVLDGGRRTVYRLARVHSHGGWIAWDAPALPHP